MPGISTTCVDLAAQSVGEGLLDFLAVGCDLYAALDGVGHLGAPGLDRQR